MVGDQLLIWDKSVLMIKEKDLAAAHIKDYHYKRKKNHTINIFEMLKKIHHVNPVSVYGVSFSEKNQSAQQFQS